MTGRRSFTGRQLSRGEGVLMLQFALSDAAKRLAEGQVAAGGLDRFHASAALAGATIAILSRMSPIDRMLMAARIAEAIQEAGETAPAADALAGLGRVETPS